MHMVSIRVRYGLRWHSDKPYRAIESQTSSLWLLRVPSKPIAREWMMHVLARDTLKFKPNIKERKTNHKITNPGECDMASDENCT